MFVWASITQGELRVWQLLTTLSFQHDNRRISQCSGGRVSDPPIQTRKAPQSRLVLSPDSLSVHFAQLTPNPRPLRPTRHSPRLHLLPTRPSHPRASCLSLRLLPPNPSPYRTPACPEPRCQRHIPLVPGQPRPALGEYRRQKRSPTHSRGTRPEA